MSAPATAARPVGPHLRVRGRDYPVVLPKLADPRLRVAAVLLTVQVLGQTVLGFKLSIAQILVTIGVCALVDTTVTLWRDQALVWPASAMLTGNSIALLLRATGTQHGDWWSLHGIEFFILAALVSLAAKYFVRPTGRHIFNPSNVGLVWVLLVVGPAGVFPQYLWWGPLSLPVGVTVAVIVCGGVWVLRPLGLLPMTASFLATLGVLVAAFAVAGNSFWALWSPEPISGLFYWTTIVLSPETLIFVFFMMSDPVTAPKSPPGRIVFGVITALLAAGLLSFQPTEFGVKLAILSSLTVTCALVPFLEAAVRRIRGGVAASPANPDAPRPALTRAAHTARRPAVVAAAIIALVAPAGTAQLAGNEQIIIMEQGRSGEANPQ